MSDGSLDRSVQFLPGKCIVAFLIDGDRCETNDFLEKLEKSYPLAYSDLMKTLERLSKKGDVRIVDKVKHVGKGVWQVNCYKASIPRLYGFTTSLGEHVITHGSKKRENKAQLETEYTKTRRYKDRWEKEHP